MPDFLEFYIVLRPFISAGALAVKTSNGDFWRTEFSPFMWRWTEEVGTGSIARQCGPFYWHTRRAMQ